jgi:hypothetical protein
MTSSISRDYTAKYFSEQLSLRAEQNRIPSSLLNVQVTLQQMKDDGSGVTSIKLKAKLRGLSQRENYTDRATAAAKFVQTFADRGCRVGSETDPYGRILVFLDRSRYYVFQVASQLYSRG